MLLSSVMCRQRTDKPDLSAIGFCSKVGTEIMAQGNQLPGESQRHQTKKPTSTDLAKLFRPGRADCSEQANLKATGNCPLQATYFAQCLCLFATGITWHNWRPWNDLGPSWPNPGQFCGLNATRRKLLSSLSYFVGAGGTCREANRIRRLQSIRGTRRTSHWQSSQHSTISCGRAAQTRSRNKKWCGRMWALPCLHIYIIHNIQ